MNKFPIKRLGDFVLKIGSGITPRGGSEVYINDGVALIRSQNIYNNEFSYDGLAFISDEIAEKMSGVTVEKDDILLNITGDSVARVCQVPDDVLPARVNQHVSIIRPNATVFDIKFVRYFLASQYMQNYMLMLSGAGATRKALTKGMIEDFEIPCPDIEIQRTISHILGSLDDKIEANRRMNETLEATARTIFKSWFVDFDPVHDKAMGEHPYGMGADTAALFPNRFQESELGFIPQGWGVDKIGNHVNTTRGLSYKGKHLSNEADDTAIPMHNLNSIYEGGGYKYEGVKWYNGDYKERHEIEPKDLIVTNTEQGFNLLLIGYPAIIPARFPTGIFSHHLYKVVPQKTSPLSHLYLHYLMLTRKIHDTLGGFTNGTTVNMLPSDAFEIPKILIPSKPLIDKFNLLVQPILDKQEQNEDENQALAELRETLLPRLISGELCVGDVSEFVGDV